MTTSCPVIPVVEIELEPQHPWRRFSARIIDMFLYYILSKQLLSYFATTSFTVCTVLANYTALYLYVMMIVWEIAIMAALGQTPGKWLLGIKVISLFKTKPSFAQSFDRTLLVWFHGLWLAIIPISVIFPMLLSWKKLNADNDTSWDFKAETTVVYQKITTLRYGLLLATILAVIIYLL